MERDGERHRTKALFSSGRSHHRIGAPYYPAYPAHGVGDTFAATLLASALCARAVANTGTYGGASVDPVAALSKRNPLGYHVDEERTMRFCERSNVDSEMIKPTAQDGPHLKFAPPKHKIIYG